MLELVQSFEEDISQIDPPDKFNYPLYYKPHKLALLAARQLEQFIQSQPWFKPGDAQQAGKMFGVLVIEKADGSLGFLSGFSGKLAGKTSVPGFVPPVYELKPVDDFFAQETAKLDQITQQITALENDAAFIKLSAEYLEQKKRNKVVLEQERDRIKAIKRNRRKFLKQQQTELSLDAFALIEKEQRQLSLNNNFFLKEYEIYLNSKIAPIESRYFQFIDQLEELKKKRRDGSNWLQDWLFNQYNFLNAQGDKKNVKQLFKGKTPETPPAATGDCAAPKLLQYAFEQGLKPVTMAEFWYGPAPPSKIRKQGNFYPACRSKCEPVLEFMLQGLEVEENPLLTEQKKVEELQIIYEDDHLAVVNKPADFLSVPGKTISDCVQSRMKERYPEATGPLIVHRLDMATSGLLLIAKSLAVYHQLQEQFVKRVVKKRYVALLDGIVKLDQGEISLPIRLDLDNRPSQMVDSVHGKTARTRYQVLGHPDGKTRIHLFPITGRTHQLRVHCAHKDGLATPIAGDDLYGTSSNRLYLHAEKLVFKHPLTQKRTTIIAPAPF